MEIEERHVDDVVVLELKGEMRAGEGDKLLRETIDSLVDAGHTKIAIDLKDVPFVDSAGLGEIVRCYTTVCRRGGVIKLRNLTRRVHSFLPRLFSWFGDDDDDWPSGAAGVTSLGAVPKTKPQKDGDGGGG